jgi:hypothetical protein
MSNLSSLIHSKRYGQERRLAIIQCLKDHPTLSITVNRMWCVQLRHDPDLQKLLKQGVLKRQRTGRPTCRWTELVLNEKK